MNALILILALVPVGLMIRPALRYDRALKNARSTR